MREENPITWSGTTRPPLKSAGIWPRPLQDGLPVWIAVGGTPASVVRAGSLALLFVHRAEHARVGRLDRGSFEVWASPHGALFAGSPAEIIDMILWEHEVLGHSRFLAQLGLGGLPQAETLRSIELLAGKGVARCALFRYRIGRRSPGRRVRAAPDRIATR